MNNKINSKTRLNLSLNHKEPDRVPIDLGSMTVSGIHIRAYSDLIKELKKKENIKIYDKYQQLAYVSESIIKELNIDTIPIIFDNLEEYVENNEEEIVLDDWGIKRKKPKNGYYYDVIFFPLKDMDISQLKKINFLNILKKIDYKGAKLRNKSLKDNDKAVIGQIWPGGVFSTAQLLRGFEQFLIDLYSNKLFAETLMGKLLEYNIEYADRLLKSFGDVLDVVKIADDLAMQNALFFPVEFYRKNIKDKHKKLIEFIKSKTNAKVLFHCCGAVKDYIPDLIEIGVDIIQPVQVSAKGMDDTKKLKKDFGKDIVFWGGVCDAQNILPRGNEKDIENEVKKRISDLAPGGGFIFSPIHNIQPGIPAKNIISMFNTVIKHGRYC